MTVPTLELEVLAHHWGAWSRFSGRDARPDPRGRVGKLYTVRPGTQKE